jgi:hypothetical protein
MALAFIRVWVAMSGLNGGVAGASCDKRPKLIHMSRCQSRRRRLPASRGAA